MRNLTILLAVVAMFAVPAQANLLTNGDFEAWTGGDPDGWDNSASATEVTGLDGTGSAAHIPLGSDKGLRQDLSSTLTGQFFVQYDAAGEQPTSNRTMYFSLRAANTDPLILIRVDSSGDLQTYDSSASAYVTVTGTAGKIAWSNFSTPSIKVYRVTLSGDLATDSYDISLYDVTNSTAIASVSNWSKWYKDDTAGIDRFGCEQSNIDAAYRVDDVIVDVPEPATLTLLGLGGIGLLLRRRRRA